MPNLPDGSLAENMDVTNNNKNQMHISSKNLTSSFGRLQGTLIWGVSALFFLYGWVHRTSPSAMIDELMVTFRADAVLIGILSGLYFWAYAAMQIPVGLLVDRLGPRLILTIACTFAALGSGLFAWGFIKEFIVLAYVGRLLIGAAAGVGFVCAISLAARWCPKHRFGLLTGSTMMAGMIGGAIGQGPIAVVVADFGVATIMLGLGGIGIGLAFLVRLLVRDHPPGTCVQHTEPSSEASILIGIQSIFQDMGQILQKPQSWFIGLFALFQTGQLFIFATLWGVPYLQQAYAIERSDAAVVASIMALSFGGGGMLIGMVGDRFESLRALMLIGAMLIIPLWGVLLYGPLLPLWLSISLLVLIGLLLGNMVLSYPLCRRHSPKQMGAALGWTNMFTMLSGALFQPLTGWLLDLSEKSDTLAGSIRVYNVEAYQSAFTVLPILAVAALITALFIRDHPVEKPD